MVLENRGLLEEEGDAANGTTTSTNATNRPSTASRGNGRGRGGRTSTNTNRRESASLHDLEMMEAVQATQRPSSTMSFLAEHHELDHPSSDVTSTATTSSSLAPFLTRNTSGRSARSGSSSVGSAASGSRRSPRQSSGGAASVGYSAGGHVVPPSNPYLSNSTRRLMDDDDPDPHQSTTSFATTGGRLSTNHRQPAFGQTASSSLLGGAQEESDDDDHVKHSSNPLILGASPNSSSKTTKKSKTPRPKRSKSGSALTGSSLQSKLGRNTSSSNNNNKPGKNYEWGSKAAPSPSGSIHKGKIRARPNRSSSAVGLVHRSHSPKRTTTDTTKQQQQQQQQQPLMGGASSKSTTSATSRTSRASRIPAGRDTAHVDVARKFLHDNDNVVERGHPEEPKVKVPVEQFQDESEQASVYSEFSEYSESMHNNSNENAYDEFDLEWHQQMAAGSLPPSQQNRYLVEQQRTRQQQQTMPMTGGGGGDVNIFDQRQDLREVDQTINLMDASSEVYAHQQNPPHNRRFGGKRRKQTGPASFMASMNNSFVDVFLNDGGSEKSFIAPFRRQQASKGNHHSQSLRGNGTRNFDYSRRGNGYDKSTCTKWLVCVVIALIILVVALPQGTIWLEMFAGLVPEGDANGVAANGTLGAVTVQDQREILRGVILQHGLTNETDLDMGPTFENNNVSSPQFQALQWLAEEQPLDALLLPELADLPQNLERYALAVLYFATNGKGWRQSSKWLTHASATTAADEMCSWYGIDCEVVNIHGYKSVVHLNLTQNNLYGELPSEMKAFPHLVVLDLSGNNLQGSIPSELGLHYLKFLHLYDNQVTGGLPSELGKSVLLEELLLSNNQVTQTIPTELNLMTELRALLLDGNQLQGTVPNLEGMVKLEYLYLNDNQLTGPVPYGPFVMLSLVDIRMGKNKLHGTIPPEVESIHHLQVLSLGQNLLSGSLPDIFDRLTWLKELDVHENKLHGPLPKTFDGMANLTRLHLDHNDFTGTIPSYTDLPKLRSLRFHYTKLSGSIPESICSLKTDFILESVLADCASDSMYCSCCDECY